MESVHLGLEWWEENRAWLGPVGWTNNRPNPRLDHCILLASCVFCRVCFVLYPPVGLTDSRLSLCSIYYLYVLIRRPRLILDFALTLIFNHLVLTSYYSASVPTSLFFWLVMILGSALTVIAAEQLCVKREMREGLTVPVQGHDAVEEMELGTLLRRD
jgi:Integral membrane protein S linking to the trans Golgi network